MASYSVFRRSSSPWSSSRRAARAAGSPTARCSPRAMLLIRSTRSRAAVTAASCSSVSSGGRSGRVKPSGMASRACPPWAASSSNSLLAPSSLVRARPCRSSRFRAPGEGGGAAKQVGHLRGKGVDKGEQIDPAVLPPGFPVRQCLPHHLRLSGGLLGCFVPAGGSPPPGRRSPPRCPRYTGPTPGPPGRRPAPPGARARTAARASAPQQAAPPRIQGRKLPSSTAPRAADRTSSARPTLRRRGKRRFSLRARSSASRQRARRRPPG